MGNIRSDGSIKEQLILFETAKLAKNKGFKIGIGWYSIDSIFYYKGELTTNYRGDNPCAPTQSLLQKWLRDVHKIIVWVTAGYYMSNIIYNVEISYIDKDTNLFKEITPKLSNYSNMGYGGTYEDSYDAALEIGLIEALKLIK